MEDGVCFSGENLQIWVTTDNCKAFVLSLFLHVCQYEVLGSSLDVSQSCQAPRQLPGAGRARGAEPCAGPWALRGAQLLPKPAPAHLPHTEMMGSSCCLPGSGAARVDCV